MAPIEVIVSDHKDIGWKIRKSKIIQPREDAEFDFDPHIREAKLIVSCNETDDGGEATVRNSAFAWTEDTEGNLIERIHPEAKIPIQRDSTIVINRRSLTRVQVKHVPSK